MVKRMSSIPATRRTMTVAVLMASDLKAPDEHVQIRIDGEIVKTGQ